MFRFASRARHETFTNFMNVVLFGAVMFGSVIALKHYGSKVNRKLLNSKAMSLEQFRKILQGESRSSCQINDVNVRETLDPESPHTRS